MSYWPTGETTRDGRPIWECRACGARVAGHIVAEHPCVEAACLHRGELLGEVGCGCGNRDLKLPVYACDIHGQCTQRASGKPQRFAGRKIAVCVGCPQSVTA